MRSHTLLRYVRLVHLYLGVFTAPALIFFAFTGALQTFSLHETTRGSSYKPPAWAVTLGQLHKKQTTVVSAKKLPPPEKSTPADKANGSQPAPIPAAPAVQQHNAMPLKIFFLIVSIGLFYSTLSGIYMSYKYIRNRVMVTGALVAGIVIPVVFTIF
ncbi:MAG: hypothetical protein JWQ42_2178 [Edaphobacter sp.]|nr:hypothetical protein [Edaphobacter sp.]